MRRKTCEDCGVTKAEVIVCDDPISGNPIALCDACFDRRAGVADEDVSDWGKAAK